MRVRTILTPAGIDLLSSADLSSSFCVVFDVLRATTTIVAALRAGVRGVYPVGSIEEALAIRGQISGAVLAGERGGEKIPGFHAGNSPLEFGPAAGRMLVMTTTNGTLAFQAAARAGHLVAAALCNLDAVAARLNNERWVEVVLICAGTGRDCALEDVFAAGCLAQRLGLCEMDDATRLAIVLAVAMSPDIGAFFRSTANGRALVAAGRDEDVACAAETARTDCVPTRVASAPYLLLAEDRDIGV